MVYRYLNDINSPDDLRPLPDSAMPLLAEEIRDFLVHKVEKNGGHLASNLGVVELTLALHRVFDFSRDHLIFDVGHQSYVHKILTGRRKDFDCLRTPGGLSGFTNREESPYDAFGAGHSSTAISAALGFAEADHLAGRNAFSVAVVGDGAYTGGMVHEALNNILPNRNLIIILNENEMSIAKNIGEFASYLAKVRSSRRYVKIKRYTASFLSKVPLIGKGIYRLSRKIKQKMKNALYNSNYFEELGLYYIGPVDGNDYEFVSAALMEAKEKHANVLIHLKTVKGKGYTPAENAPSSYHNLPKASPPKDSFHSVFGEAVTELAERNKSITAITAAMGEGTGLHDFMKRFPDRFFDVGIAEEHAVTFAGGLAAAGLRPFFAVYSTFLQRAYDNVLHDVALQALPVKFAVDRAGLAPADGATHHGIFDVSFLSAIPNIKIFAPATYGSMRAILADMASSDSPEVVRYPNAKEDPRAEALFYPERDFANYGVRSSYCESDTPDVIVITYGHAVSTCISAKEEAEKNGISVGIVLLEALKPYEETGDRLLPLLPENTPTVFLEEGIYAGGAAMLLNDCITKKRGQGFTEILAIRDSFVIPKLCGTDIYEYAGIGKNALTDAIKRIVHK